MDAKFIEERREFLEFFCKKLALLKYFWYSDEFEIFLARASAVDVEKVFNIL